jgi:hypothetical protein
MISNVIFAIIIIIPNVIVVKNIYVMIVNIKKYVPTAKEHLMEIVI